MCAQYGEPALVRETPGRASTAFSQQLGAWFRLNTNLRYQNCRVPKSEMRPQLQGTPIITMKFRMDKIIRELVEEAWEWGHLGRDREFVDRDEVFMEALIALESEGDAMRFVDSKGRIAWKATPDLRDYLNDLKSDAEGDLEDEET